MTLKESNPYLKSASVRKAALRLSAQTSSAVEGIRTPFAGKRDSQPKNTEAFIALWKRRAVAIDR